MRSRSELFGRIYTVIAILLIIYLYSTIFQFSAMPAVQSTIQSTSVAQRLTEIIEALLAIDLPFNNSAVQLNELDGFVRKAAHFTEYALLGLLTYSISVCWNHIKNQGPIPSTLLRPASSSRKRPILSFFLGPIPTFLLTLALAAADEIHQTFVPGRSGSLRDVLLDSTGILAGILILKLLDGIYTRHRLKTGKTP